MDDFQSLNDTYEIDDVEHGENSEPGPSGGKKDPKTEKPKAKKDKAEPPMKQPTVYEMVREAIENLGDSRKGASAQAIKKYVHGKSQMEENRLNTLIKKALLKGIADGTFTKPLKQTSGGATGSFLLAKLKPKGTKRLVRKKPVDVAEHSSADDSEDFLDTETVVETRKGMDDFSDTDTEDIDEEETRLKEKISKSQKFPKKVSHKEEAKANRTKKVSNEDAKANKTKKIDNEDAKASRTKKINNKEAKASEAKGNNEETKTSRTKKVNNEEAKASGTKINHVGTKVTRTRKVNDEEAKASGTKKINKEEPKASGTKKINKEEPKASGTKKANMKETKENTTKKRQKLTREKADSSDSEVVVKKTRRKSTKAYSSDTDMDFVELEEVHAPSKKPNQVKADKAESLKKSKAKTEAKKLYRAEANEDNINTGKTKSKKKT